MTVLLALSSGFQAISDSNGVAISVTGMLIVFVALVVISLFIRLLPEVLNWLEPILPKLEVHSHPPTAAEQLPVDHQRIVAGIGYVLHLEMEKAAGSSK